MSDSLEWKVLSEETLLKTRIFDINSRKAKRIDDGVIGDFFTIDSADWVNITAIDEDQRAVLIRQFRHASQSYEIEIPGGTIDEGEEPALAAERELLEETGYKCSELIALGFSLPNPAIHSNKIYHFLALNCRKISEPKFDTHERITTELTELSELFKAAEDGRIRHSLAIACIYRAFRYLDQNKVF